MSFFDEEPKPRKRDPRATVKRRLLLLVIVAGGIIGGLAALYVHMSTPTDEILRDKCAQHGGVQQVPDGGGLVICKDGYVSSY